MIGFELVGGFVAERLVETIGIVKRFDVLEQTQSAASLRCPLAAWFALSLASYNRR